MHDEDRRSKGRRRLNFTAKDSVLGDIGLLIIYLSTLNVNILFNLNTFKFKKTIKEPFFDVMKCFSRISLGIGIILKAPVRHRNCKNPNDTQPYS